MSSDKSMSSKNEDNSTPVAIVKDTMMKEDDQSSSSDNDNDNDNDNITKIDAIQAGGEDTDKKIIIADAITGKEKDDPSVLLVRNDEKLPKHSAYNDADAYNDVDAYNDADYDIDIDIDDKKSYLQAQTKEDSSCSKKKIGMTVEKGGKIKISDPAAEIFLMPNDDNKCDNNYADALHKDIEAAIRTRSSTTAANNHPDPPNRSTSNLSASSSSRTRSNRTIPGAFAINNPMFDSSSSSSTLRQTIIEPRISSLLTNNNRSSYDDTGTTASATMSTLSPPSQEIHNEDNSSAEQHHIVEAVCVEEQKVFEASIVTGDDLLSTEDGRSTKMWYYNVAIAVLLLLAVVVALSVVLTQQQQNQVIDANNKWGADNTAGGGELGPPTMAPSNDPYRREAIRAILAPLSGDGVFDINSIEFSPDRNAALDWIVDDNRVPIDNPSLHWKICQRYILALFYFSTNGAGWEDQYHFISGLDECEWSSVTTRSGKEKDFIEGAICNIQGKLERIIMLYNKLTGVLPHELSHFSDSLLEMNIGGGSMSGQIPSSLEKLTNMNTLGIDNHCFSGTIPEFSKIPTLSVLLIDNNAAELNGSLNGFCNGTEMNDGMIKVVSDCGGCSGSDDSVFIECDCCYCCNEDDFVCCDKEGTSLNSTTTNLDKLDLSANGFVQPFDKQCLSEKKEQWIQEECPCVVNIISDAAEDTRPLVGECTTDCTAQGAIRSYDY